MTRRSRRAVLAGLAAATAGLAGCSGSDSEGTATPTAEATPSPTPTALATTRTTGRPTTTAGTTDEPTTAETTTQPPEEELPTTGPPTAGVEAFDERVPDLLREWELPGAAVSVAQGERLVFTRGYGFADVQAEDPVRPASLFRVASISKPITAVATLDLVERGRLALDDGAFEILSDLVPEGGPADPRVRDVTVAHLLRHTAGFSVESLGYDPGFRSVETARQEDETPPASPEAKIRNVLGRELGFEPGTGYEYANIGYLILGRIVERVANADYEPHVRQGVLDDLGITRARIGGTRRADLADDEVRYYGNRRVASVFPDEGQVRAPYGAFGMPSIDSFGGWVASTVDLLRFLGGIDGRGGRPDVLSSATRTTMTERPDVEAWSDAEQHYGMGWYVIPDRDDRPGLWHNGSLPGSYGFVIREPNSDLAMAALFNARPERFGRFNVAAQRTLGEALGSVSSWPDRDLFDQFP